MVRNSGQMGKDAIYNTQVVSSTARRDDRARGYLNVKNRQ